MSVKLSRIFLVVAVLAHFCLALGFAIRTPYRQSGYILSFGQRNPVTGEREKTSDIGAPDERQHANYIAYLQKNGKKPVFDPKSPTLGEDYQSHQPATFYWLGRFAAGSADVESQEFGQKVRILNCVIGALGVAGTFFAALWGTRRNEIATIAALFQALLPMNCALSGAISNDPLLICACSWAFAMVLRLFADSNDETHRNRIELTVSMLAAFTIVACITKSSGLAILLVSSLALLYATSLKRVRLTQCLVAFAFMLAVPTVLVWAQNMKLYGDPLAQSAFKEAFINSPKKEAIIAQIQASDAAGSPEVQYWMNWIGYWTARSFIGTFGYMDIWLNETSRALSNVPNLFYKLLIGFNFVGLLSGFAYLRSKGKEFRIVTTVILSFLGIVTVLFILFNMVYFQAQARYLFPALSGFSIVLALGWSYLFKGKWQIAFAAVVLIYGGTSLYALNKLPEEFQARISGSLPPRS